MGLKGGHAVRPATRIRRGLLLTAFASAALVAGACLYARMRPPSAPSAPQSTASTAAVDAAPPMAVAQPAASAAVAASPEASAIHGRGATPSMPQVETAAESLRKVQVALASGTAQEALSGAAELEGCAHADRTATALMQSRDTIALLPDEVKTIFDKIPPPSAAMIARAQADQRRCQVFDAATLARRGELYQKAYEGGAEGWAQSYLMWLQSDDGPKDKADPALIGRLQVAVRADAKAANLGALAGFAYGGSYIAAQTAASPVEAQAYREAYFRIIDETSTGGPGSTRAQADKIMIFGPKPPALTQEQQREADALTGQVVDAWHRRSHPGG